MIEGRLINTLEGVAFAACFALLFYVVAVLAKRLLNKSIGSPKYYVVVVVTGFILHRAIVAFWAGPSVDYGRESSPSPMATVAAENASLDAPLIPVAESELEKFPIQLKHSIQLLNKHDQAQVNEAIGFLTFALFADLTEKDPKALDRLEDSDIAAKSLTKLYRFAQKNGSSMTLRKYIELAEEFKRQEPQWWRQYVESAKKK